MWVSDHRQVRFLPLFHRRFSNGPGLPPPPPPLPVKLGSRPILFISIFAILHQSFAYVSLFPVYGYFHFTDTSMAFLVGSHITSLLRKPLPFSPGGRTVEDVVDTVMGYSIKTGWNFWNKWKGRKSDEREGEEIAKEFLGELKEKRSLSEHREALKNQLVEMKERAVGLRDDLGKPTFSSDTLRVWRDRGMNRLVHLKNYAVESKDKLGNSSFTVDLSVEKLREWKDRGMEIFPEFDSVIQNKNGTLKAITDATAVYLVVKASAPLRLAVNLFLTPKVARLLVRRWG